VKKLLAGLVLALTLFVGTAKAQTRVLVGADGGSSFSNLFVGPEVAIEVPIGKKVELDLKDVFMPFEEHTALGSGTANKFEGGGIIWVKKDLGLNGRVDYSEYNTEIKKSGEYAAFGATVRKSFNEFPVRFTFDYIQEFHNGIFPNNVTGTESPHLKAGEFNLDMRMGCGGKICYRLSFDFMIGHVLTQGNPACDGTLGNTGGNGPNGSCPRTGASSGSFTSSIVLEFPRHRAIEGDAF
jgi:hypothetical protein